MAESSDGKAPFAGHAGPVLAVAYSLDGTTLITTERKWPAGPHVHGLSAPSRQRLEPRYAPARWRPPPPSDGGRAEPPTGAMRVWSATRPPTTRSPCQQRRELDCQDTRVPVRISGIGQMQLNWRDTFSALPRSPGPSLAPPADGCSAVRSNGCCSTLPSAVPSRRSFRRRIVAGYGE